MNSVYGHFVCLSYGQWMLDILSKENSKGKPHTDNTDSIFAWSGVRWGGWLYSLYDIPSFCVYCSWASFSYLLIFTWRKSWFRFINTRSGRNQCASATSGLDLPSRKDCTPRFGQIYNGALAYHNMRSLYLTMYM